MKRCGGILQLLVFKLELLAIATILSRFLLLNNYVKTYFQQQNVFCRIFSSNSQLDDECFPIHTSECNYRTNLAYSELQAWETR